MTLTYARQDAIRRLADIDHGQRTDNTLDFDVVIDNLCTVSAASHACPKQTHSGTVESGSFQEQASFHASVAASRLSD